MKTQRKKILFNHLMKLRHAAVARREEKSFEASSMGDIAFLLLIFFIVTSSFILRQGIFLTLPSPNAGSQKIEKELLIEVAPQANGYLYNGSLLSHDDFIDAVKERIKENSDSIALIYMNDTIKYSRLIDTLSLLQKNGVKKVSVKDKPKEEL
ncbi:MAG: biopolymer transporter ExbD [Spirochaetes bacterium]|jgi:biopolymer transport protein ExbD|nr:biopolymer transporter ExbD [Spirochaetota bacterium]